MPSDCNLSMLCPSYIWSNNCVDGDLEKPICLITYGIYCSNAPNMILHVFVLNPPKTQLWSILFELFEYDTTRTSSESSKNVLFLKYPTHHT